MYQLRRCLNCNEEFNAPTKELRRGNGKFCSIGCGSSFRRKLQGSHKNVICSTCGLHFHKSQSQMKASKSGLFFCSRKCKDKAQRIGGIKQIQPQHYGDYVKDYRALAFRSLEPVCSHCHYDKHPEILEVHHKDGDRENNTIYNLEILCPRCHSERHFLEKTGKWSIK